MNVLRLTCMAAMVSISACSNSTQDSTISIAPKDGGSLTASLTAPPHVGSPAISTPDVFVKPLQKIWEANGTLASKESGATGFASAFLASDGIRSIFTLELRATLPPIEGSTNKGWYSGWLVRHSPQPPEVLDAGVLVAQDDQAYILKFEKEITDGKLDYSYMNYLDAFVTREPDGSDILSGKLKIVHSIGWSPEEGKDNVY